MKNITMKFGGTSVGDPDAIEQVINIIQTYRDRGNQVAVIVSAMSGVTNMLLQSVSAALAGDKWGYISLSTEIRDKHEEVVNLLIHPSPSRENILSEIQSICNSHTELCEAINILGEATPRIRDAIVSFGERLSSRVIAAVMQSRGLDARAVDSTDYIITNGDYGNAEPIWDITEKRITERLRPLLDSGTTPIITGFIGATPDGIITTLGRGGSDFSGAIFASYLEADELIIWTDVDGVMTTDPRLDKRARVLPYVSYSEVGEMAFYGAKVLHPKTVQPIVNREIPLRVRNTFNPDHPGTRIGAEMAVSDTVIKAVTAIRSVSMLTVSGRGMLGVPGIAGRTFSATASAGASILMISQSSSEQSFCFTVTDDRADSVKGAVESELSHEINQRDVEGVEVLSDVVIVTVVGAGMRGTPGVAGRVFTTLGEHGINVISIAQGGSECSISFVIDEHNIVKAVQCLHDLALDAVPN